MNATRLRPDAWFGRAWDRLTGALDDLAFPTACALCDATPDGASPALCSNCLDSLTTAADAARCPRCAEKVGPYADLKKGCSECRGESLGFDAAVTLGTYDGPLRDLCLKLKHGPGSWLAPWLADIYHDARREAILDALGTPDQPPLVVPVPLHWSREFRRGHNQAELLAERLAERLGTRLTLALKRRRSTSVLAGMSRNERLKTLKDAFAPRKDVRGRTVLLIDDILTTGATTATAARALKSAGAKRVVVGVLARTSRN